MRGDGPIWVESLEQALDVVDLYVWCVYGGEGVRPTCSAQVRSQCVVWCGVHVCMGVCLCVEVVDRSV